MTATIHGASTRPTVDPGEEAHEEVALLAIDDARVRPPERYHELSMQSTREAGSAVPPAARKSRKNGIPARASSRFVCSPRHDGGASRSGRNRPAEPRRRELDNLTAPCI